MAVFYLKKDLSEKELNFVGENLKKSPLVTDVQFISSEQALQKFKGTFPGLQEIIDNLKTNPLPPSFEVALSDKVLNSDEILGFIDEMKNIIGVEDVQFNRDWVVKIQSFSRLARAVGFFFGGILILASFFIISNVIKLNVFARKDEIEILHMIGATNTFIRTPFILEGVVLGISGGILSLLFLYLLAKFFSFYLGTSLGVLNEIINFRYLSLIQTLILLGGGAIIGFSGSLSSLSRFLKTQDR
ncbi:MAG: cell division protein FtsX [Candidatus Aminicenantaceae bacterium]